MNENESSQNQALVGKESLAGHETGQVTTDDLTQDRAAESHAAEPVTTAGGDALIGIGGLEGVRERLKKTRGASYWRSLEELAGTPDFRDMLHREFPRHASEWDGSVDRRRFMQLASASLALAGLAGCTRQPVEKIVPYVRQPETIVPGRPLYFATTHTVGGYATGVLAESHLGRPTKIEGNPDHPASQGKTDLLAQASVLDLYDPDRSQAVQQLGQPRTWTALKNELGPKAQALLALEGEGLRILTGNISSPTVLALLDEIRETMPKAVWHQHEAAGRENVHTGVKQAFGEPGDMRYDLAAADVVLALDADFLMSGPGAVRYARDFARGRQVRDPEAVKHDGMSRLYVAESGVTATGSTADHRLAVKPTEVAHFAVALASRLGVAGASMPEAFADGERHEWLEAVASDLEAHRGAGLVLAGDVLEPEVHVLVHAINEHLGNLGTTVLVSDSVIGEPQEGGSLAELVDAMEAGEVDTLFILGSNPVFECPAERDFGTALKNVGLSIHLGLYFDETASYCQWHVPETHELESWGDARAYDGTISLTQPLVEPLYGGKTAVELFGVLLGRPVNAEELVREHWQTVYDAGTFASGEQSGEGQGNGTFDTFWQTVLHDGLVKGSELPAKTVTVDAAAASEAASAVASWTVGERELAFRPDPHLVDGRFANNGWLQECPRPITKLVWDNALLMSPATAEDLGLGNLVAGSDQSKKAPLVEVAVGERRLTVPVWVVPGQADGSFVLHLGYGRERLGKVAEGAGVNAYVLRTSDRPWRVSEGVEVSRVGGHYLLASTQDHHSMEGRELVMHGTLAQYAADPDSLKPHLHVDKTKTLMPQDEFPYDGYKWGMTIDLTNCTGCNACVVACQSENNIPVVGKEQVLGGREMHWIRIDRYFTGDGPDAVDQVLHQPVICMQCEQAPCEVVCPVAATVHSDEGLNDMVYNRCVGTRYCSNNCPYKVRRFNFLLYQDFETESIQLGRNPDVTVRSRGVMEKCTYCVQRINHARIEAKRESRSIREGEIQTACQQVCPSDVFVFGDLNNFGAGPDAAPEERSEVSRAKESPLDYDLLGELGNRPRTTYLARVQNAHEALAPESSHGDGDHH